VLRIVRGPGDRVPEPAQVAAARVAGAHDAPRCIDALIVADRGADDDAHEGRSARRGLHDPNRLEPRLAEQLLDFTGGAQVVDGTGKARPSVRSVGPEAQQQRPAGPENPTDLAQLHRRFRPEIENVHGQHRVEASVLVGQPRSLRLTDLGATQPDLPPHAPGRQSDHHVGGIDPGDESARSTTRELGEGLPVSAADLEECVAWRDGE